MPDHWSQHSSSNQSSAADRHSQDELIGRGEHGSSRSLDNHNHHHHSSSSYLDATEMADLGSVSDKDGAQAIRVLSSGDDLSMQDSRAPLQPGAAQDSKMAGAATRAATEEGVITEEGGTGTGPVVYKKYKRRWFGLVQLVLLNIIVSWDWLTYSPVVNTSATFFSTTPAVVNWLSTAFLFSFCIAAPFTLYTIHKRGPKTAIVTASALLLLGNWIRYGGVRASPPSFAAVMVGQVLIGLAQPFVLALPTSYSDLWFSPRGRVSATAVASLANPFGGALGQLINPFLVNVPADTASLTLYIAIISSVATIPSFFIPARPPTPVAPSSAIARPPLPKQFRLLLANPTFYLVFASFGVYVGFFNSFSSLLTQTLTPYGFSQTDAGIAGAILILVGLVAAAIASPLVDKYKPYKLIIKIFVPIIALSYLAFIWAPGAGTIVAADVICAVLGTASFILVPVALEYLVEISYPAGPELTSVVCWTGGQALGGIFIVISEALVYGGKDGEGFMHGPNGNLQAALVFEAVVALVTIPAALAIGSFSGAESRRLKVDLKQDGGASSAGDVSAVGGGGGVRDGELEREGAA